MRQKTRHQKWAVDTRKPPNGTTAVNAPAVPAIQQAVPVPRRVAEMRMLSGQGPTTSSLGKTRPRWEGLKAAALSSARSGQTGC